MSRRDIERSSVDLPQAFAPTIAVMRPGGMTRSRPSIDDAVAVAEHEPFDDERVLFGHREPPERFERMMSQIR